MKTNQVQPVEEIIELDEIDLDNRSRLRGLSDGSIANIDRWITIGDKRRAFGMFGNSSSDAVTAQDKIKLRTFNIQQAQGQTPYDKVKKSLYLKIKQSVRSVDDTFQKFDIFSRPINRIVSNSGYGIGVVFKLLRWLFLLTLLKTLLIGMFLMIPQFLYRLNCLNGYTDNSEFTALTLFTGEGFLKYSEFFYGFYYALPTSNNESNFDNCLHESFLPYYMTRAYFYVFVIVLLLIGILILKKTMTTYKAHYSAQTEEFHNRNTAKLFSVWDYNLTNKKTAQLKSANIYYIIKDILKKQSSRSSHSWLKYLPVIAYYLVVTVLCLFVLVGSCFLVYYQTTLYAHLESGTEHPLPFVISTALVVIIPKLFDIVVSYGVYKHEAFVIYFSVVYLVLYQLGVLISLLIPWISLVQCVTDKNVTSVANLTCNYPIMFEMKPVIIDSDSLLYNCWETWIGRHFYTLIIMNSISFVVITLFLYLFKWIVSLCIARISAPQFFIAGHALHAIYIQIICWCGMFYCPMLPLYCCLYTLINFFLFKSVAMHLCRTYPKELSSFRAPFGIMMIVSTLYIGSVAMLAIMFVFNTPSTDCGPFQGLQNGYFSSGIDFLKWGSIVNQHDVFKVFTPVFEIFFNDSGLLYMLLLLVFWHYWKSRENAAGKQTLIEVYRKNLKLIDRDKVYLLKRLNDAKALSVQTVAVPRNPIVSNVNPSSIVFIEEPPMTSNSLPDISTADEILHNESNQNADERQTPMTSNSLPDNSTAEEISDNKSADEGQEGITDTQVNEEELSTSQEEATINEPTDNFQH